MLAAGEGSAPDPKRSAAYYRVAAEAGDGLSQNEWAGRGHSRVVAVQVEFERQTLKPLFHLIGYRLWV
jgi:ribosomal protein S10